MQRRKYIIYQEEEDIDFLVIFSDKWLNQVKSKFLVYFYDPFIMNLDPITPGN